MRLKNYKEDLLERLKNPDYAAEYLAQVLAEKDKAAFLLALKDVVEATGGMSVMAKRVGLKRPSLYKVFSKRGNPTLEIRLLNIRRFGPKGEKLSSLQAVLLLEEPSVTAQEVAQEAELPPEQKEQPLPRAKQPRPNHPGRQRLPEHLERREEVVACCPEDCTCPKCGAQRPVIGYETREELMCEPAKFWVRIIKREKRGSHCEEEQGVVTAPAPTQIVPKGKLSNEFIIEVLVRKYQLHLPVYRQCAALVEDFGIALSRKTLTDAILAAGGLLQAVVRAQRLELLSGGYLQAGQVLQANASVGEKGTSLRAARFLNFGARPPQVQRLSGAATPRLPIP